jgi:hypothetical protein
LRAAFSDEPSFGCFAFLERNMFNRAIVASAIGFASLSAQAVTLLTESFDNVAGLSASGWSIVNNSSPLGSTDWYQGDSTIFTAQSGSAEAYVAANFNSAAAGGTINDLLITPAFSTAASGTVTFWAKADIQPGFSDQIVYGIYSSGAFVAPTTVTLSGTWTLYTINFAAAGAGSNTRFAIDYTGLADTSNYIGVDTVTVTAVPEPTAALMLAAGLAGLAVARRRAQG